ncbi:alanine racemase [Rhizobium sp. TRM95111]|uniref:alanine racemase n=1 Tax=Rhizobium alarense TaxID=2846851 RepID=UPI001F3C26AD|nr:alanine racemase [Rhizobium alarense]MCF3640403.1 alanine racemase [Rhizobium alarense]
MADARISIAGSDPLVDDRMRGFPAGARPLPLSQIGKQGWRPFDGRMSLPLISLDRAAFAGNVRAMMSYARAEGIEIAPHAKTPMSAAIAAELVAAGAWGTTVADIRQASVMLKTGLPRLILANEIGGRMAASRLASLLAGHPDAEVHVFVDSVELVTALAAAWRERDDLPPLGLLVELGLARAGARSVPAAATVLDAVLATETSRFRLAGIGSYEGAAATDDPEETRTRIDRLMVMTGDLLALARARATDRKLLVTAGGSIYFDLAVKALKPLVVSDGSARLVLRSGAIFFHDHGVYERGLEALDVRGGFRRAGKRASTAFRPALRLWAEVLSCPEPGLAICGMGLRDVAMDQGLPRPLKTYRDGQFQSLLDRAAVTRLNDQHAFVAIPADTDMRIGDVVEFGISHPCTCLDRHAILYGLDQDGTVTAAYATCFG